MDYHNDGILMVLHALTKSERKLKKVKVSYYKFELQFMINILHTVAIMKRTASLQEMEFYNHAYGSMRIQVPPRAAEGEESGGGDDDVMKQIFCAVSVHSGILYACMSSFNNHMTSLDLSKYTWGNGSLIADAVVSQPHLRELKLRAIGTVCFEVLEAINSHGKNVTSRWKCMRWAATTRCVINCST